MIFRLLGVFLCLRVEGVVDSGDLKIEAMDSVSLQKIHYILKAFEEYALGDIGTAQKHGMPITAFILSVCFIDQLSGFIYDSNIKGQNRKVKKVCFRISQ